MVISFSQPEAMRQLITYGEVYTYRWNRRKFFENEKGEVEYTWFNSKRNRESLGKIEIREIGEIDISLEENLDLYVEKSGFSSASEWCIVLLDVMGGIHAPNNGYLYHVKLIEED